MSNAVSELNALCDVLSFMRTPTAFPSAKQMYKQFCKPGIGTISMWYGTCLTGPNVGKIFFVHFMYILWLGMVSRLTIDTTKYYQL